MLLTSAISFCDLLRNDKNLMIIVSIMFPFVLIASDFRYSGEQSIKNSCPKYPYFSKDLIISMATNPPYECAIILNVLLAERSFTML